MDNEMKEPNDEQMRSASDEQKPNNEGKQFADGADDTPSPEDRPSNEDGVVCEKEENDSLITKAIHKVGGKKTRGHRSCCSSCCRLLFAYAVSPIVLHAQAMDQCNLYKPSNM